MARGVLSMVPGVGPVAAELWGTALRRGAEAQTQQFLQEVGASLSRAEQRVGHVELEAHLARAEAAAALNAARDVASRTARRDKHRLLANAFVNVATDHTGRFDGLSGLFWSMIDRHSPTQVRLLAAFDDPYHRARAAGLRWSADLRYGDFLFASVPELAWDFRPTVSYYDPTADRSYHDEAATEPIERADPYLENDDEGQDEDYPQYRAYEVYVRGLRTDGLITEDKVHLDMEWVLGDDWDHDNPYDPDNPKPFQRTTELGEEYLRFLGEEGATTHAGSQTGCAPSWTTRTRVDPNTTR